MTGWRRFTVVCDTDLRTRSSPATGKLRGEASSAEPLTFFALATLTILSPLFNLTLSPISLSKCEFCKTVKKKLADSPAAKIAPTGRFVLS